MRRAPCVFTLLTSILLTTATAQPLATLAPADSFAVLGWQRATAPSEAWTALKNDLEALDWERAGSTLERLGAASNDADVQEFLGMFGKRFRAGNGERWDDSKFGRCLENELPDGTLEELKNAPHSAWEEAILTVSLTSYNPLPTATAIVRVAPEYEALFTDLQRALVRCSERSGSEVRRLQEGSAPLIVLGNASDFPVIVSRTGRLFIAGSNPEAVRGVLRRVKGSREASLAQMPLFADNRALLTRPGVSVALDAAVLAEAVQSLSANFTDAETEPLVNRLVAALRTLGSYAGTLGLTGDTGRDTVTLESQLNVNPEGGDPELAALLLTDAPAPVPRFAPEGSYGVSSARMPLRPVFDYLDGWVRLVGQTNGERLGLRQLARKELGIDLDVALLDWLGDTSESVALEPYATDLKPYIYGAPQVWALETRGQAATEAGLAELSRAFKRLMSESGPDAAENELFFQSATTQQVYGGIDITRTRFGPNLDIGTAFLDDTLLVGVPAEALESAISTAQGYTRPLSEDNGFSALYSALPATTTQLSYYDAASGLQGLSDLTQLFSQPLAFVALAGLSEYEGEGSTLPPFAELLHVTDLIPNSLEVFSKHTGTLSGYSWVEGNKQRSLARLELK